MGQRKRKKSKRGSSSSETEEVMAASASSGDDSMCNELKNSLDCLRQVVSEGFVKLHTDLDKLRFEFKTEIDAVKLSIKDIEKSLTYTQCEVQDLKDHFEMETKEHSKEGKKIHGRRRPIIARFVCREDRDNVWSVRGKVKESITHADAYITEDYARAIQEERKVLIKAMMKAREEHGLSDAKVKGRFLFINNERYDSKSIPEYLKQP